MNTDGLDLLRARRSVRKFTCDPVDKTMVSGLVELAAWAPSASNRHDWHFTAVFSAELKHAMAEAVRARWREIIEVNRNLGFIQEMERYSTSFGDFERAPVVIAVAARRVDSVRRQMFGDAAAATVGGATSAAMAAQNLMLAATAHGLGSCCMTGALAASNELTRLLGLGKRMELVCLIALGWPAEAPAPPPRKQLNEVLRMIE